MKLVPTAAATFMMHAVTQPTILRRSLSLKRTARCQTRVSPPQWRHGFNHVLVAHWPGPDLPMAPRHCGSGFRDPEEKGGQNPEAFTELENVRMGNDTVS